MDTYMRTQHDRCLLCGRHGYHLDVPSPRRNGVCYVADNFAWEALLAIRIDYGERDRVGGVRNHSEVPLKMPVSTFLTFLLRELKIIHSPIHRGLHAAGSSRHARSA